jgi:putative glutamine amidotransferase
MQQPIKIGVTYTGTDEKHSNYVNWLSAGDDIRIISLLPGNSVPGQMEKLDGLVLSGGIDMHPKYYDSTVAEYPNMPEYFNEMRDEFEIALFGFAMRQRIPMLGVCRGMQLANCVLGGTLKQDIGSVGNEIHRYDQNDKAHGINIRPGSFLHEITGLERSVVNSAHHQSILILGKGLQVNCTSDDGIIEGVEWAERGTEPFFIGIQWHPERMYKLGLAESPLTKKIRDRFIQAVNKSIQHQP